MAPERLILCGEPPAPYRTPRTGPLCLSLYGPRRNVNLALDAVRREMWTDIPAVLRDLLDVAAYVYAADQATGRAGGGDVEAAEIGAGWRRNFVFRIPVRLPDLWNSPAVQAALVPNLSFLSEDEYAFEFVHLGRDTSLDGYFTYDETPLHGAVEEVVLFSGGLDSLAGAVTEAVVGRRQVLLVNHRSTTKLMPHHNRLLDGLRAAAGDRAPYHVPVWVNKDKALGLEFTQRTRSFLFASLGALFARLIGLDRVRFYENGVVSLNLPLSPQVVGARASRTTHPRVLAGFARLFTALFGRRFEVENRFLGDTKTDVVRRIADAGCGRLIKDSISCGRTMEMESQTHTSCGVCSQCVDRRFAVLAARQEDHDPIAAYATDPLLGPRTDLPAVTLQTAYLDLVERVEGMGQAEFVEHFGELARILPHVNPSTDAAAAQVFALYKRHAGQVRAAITRAIETNSDMLGRRRLPPNCLLRLVLDEVGERLDAAPTEPPRPSGNYFVRSGEFWVIRFGDGQPRHYHDDRGFQYLRLILGCPDHTFTAPELSAAVQQCCNGIPRGTTADDAAAAGVGVTRESHQAALDDEALEALAARLREIELSRPVVAASDSPTRLDDLDEMDAEERAIRSRLGSDRRLGGGARELGQVRDRVRNRVCIAIRRALRDIDRYDKPLVAHLARPVLNLGHRISYVPRSGETWTVEG